MRKRMGMLAVMMAACAARVGCAEILPDGWEWRRSLAFKQVVSDAPGENVAWAEFYTNGKQLTDGADFRITNGERVVVPHKLLQISKDHDFVRVAFATKADGPYWVWWGNAKATKPAKELEIHRGILLDVMRVGAGVDGEKGLTTESTPLASFFVNDMSLGYNPLGDDRNVVLHYAAQFKIDRAIKPLMAFTVSDLGILAIDGQTMAQEKGGAGGGLKARVRTPFPVDLSVGWHSIDVRQMNTNQAAVAMAVAWQRPGESVYTTLPPALFAQAARAVPGFLEKVGGGVAIDFSVDPTAEGFIPPSFYAQRYIFDAQFPATMKPVITWDFGDGQVLKGLKKASHVFLGPGIYPVTLKLEFGAGAAPLSVTTRVEVKDRMYAKFPRPAEDPAKTMEAVLKDYDPKKLPPEQALRGLIFFETAREDEATIGWGKAWLAAGDTEVLPDTLVSDEANAVARLLVARKQAREAAEAYRMAAAKPVSMGARANLVRLEVITLCDEADDADAAMKAALAFEAKLPESEKAGLGMVKAAEAYAAVAKGDAKGAKAAVDAATAAVTAAGAGNVSNVNQQRIRQGVLARNIENYIRTKDYDTAWQLLNQWEGEFPAAIWEGFSRTLRVRLAAAQGRYATAARLGLAHAKANPGGFYAAELLFDASENFRQGGQADQAKVVLEMLTAKYPESPYARKP